MSAALVPASTVAPWMERTRKLRPSERKYMLDAAMGLTAAQSAKRHCVTINTVHWTLKRAKFVLGAYNIPHGVALCFYYGEFELSDLDEGEE